MSAAAIRATFRPRDEQEQDRVHDFCVEHATDLVRCEWPIVPQDLRDVVLTARPAQEAA